MIYHVTVEKHNRTIDCSSKWELVKCIRQQLLLKNIKFENATGISAHEAFWAWKDDAPIEYLNNLIEGAEVFVSDGDSYFRLGDVISYSLEGTLCQ